MEFECTKHLIAWWNHPFGDVIQCQTQFFLSSTLILHNFSSNHTIFMQLALIFFFQRQYEWNAFDKKNHVSGRYPIQCISCKDPIQIKIFHGFNYNKNFQVQIWNSGFKFERRSRKNNSNVMKLNFQKFPYQNLNVPNKTQHQQNFQKPGATNRNNVIFLHFQLKLKIINNQIKNHSFHFTKSNIYDQHTTHFFFSMEHFTTIQKTL